jgi:phosphoserine aminotransferase
MARVYNFSAGPAVLPEEVLKEAAEEMMDYKGTGMSVMEMSHRSKAFDTIIKEAEQDLRDLMNIPDNYKVIFMQGGASLLFAGVAMNLMKTGKADYIITGQWAKKAYEEGRNMVKQRQLPHQLTRHSHIFLTAQTLLLMMMQIMFISAKTTLFMVQSSMNYQTQRVRHLLQTYQAVSFLNLLTLQSTALSMAVFRKMSDLPVFRL